MSLSLRVALTNATRANSSFAALKLAATTSRAVIPTAAARGRRSVSTTTPRFASAAALEQEQAELERVLETARRNAAAGMRSPKAKNGEDGLRMVRR